MNPARIAATLLATAGALALAPSAGAATTECTITAQPWDGRSYALTVVADGVPTPLITRQSGLLDGQTSWTLSGITQVWWAAKDPARQSTAADFYDVYDVDSCQLVGGYRGVPGRQPSIVVTAAAVTTTTTGPTTTTTPTPTTAPAPITTWSTTPIPTDAADVALTPAPTTTLRSPYAATAPTLPETGAAEAIPFGVLGAALTAAGALALALARKIKEAA